MNNKIYNYYLNILLVFSVAVLLFTIIPMIALGFFAHPLGDDFYYGLPAMESLRAGKGFFSVFPAAIKGTVEQYNIWQGTYSAMFLMHLPPQIFGSFFYGLYPAFVICLFTGSVFYVIKPFLYKKEKENIVCYVAVSSFIASSCIQFVLVCAETFYWFNGSFYYTGFLALTLFLFGLLFRYRILHKKWYIVISIPLAFFIAGGNYTSLLPTILILFLMIVNDIYIHNKKVLIAEVITLISILAGFMISVLAPGNALRQATSFGTTPVKAVLKSISQCFGYVLHWTPVLVFVFIILLTPVMIQVLRNSSYRFKHPYFVIPVVIGAYCSCECPTFYAQNNGGAARVFDICYYMMILVLFFSYIYLLGYIIRVSEKKKTGDTKLIGFCTAGLCVFCILLSVFRPVSESFPTPNSVTATVELINGDAAYYDLQYKNRYISIASDPGGDVAVPVIDVPEKLKSFINCGDISTNSEDNAYIAEYYGLGSIRSFNR